MLQSSPIKIFFSKYQPLHTLLQTDQNDGFERVSSTNATTELNRPVPKPQNADVRFTLFSIDGAQREQKAVRW